MKNIIKHKIKTLIQQLVTQVINTVLMSKQFIQNIEDDQSTRNYKGLSTKC